MMSPLSPRVASLLGDRRFEWFPHQQRETQLEFLEREADSLELQYAFLISIKNAYII